MEAFMPTYRRAGMEVWRSGDMEACIPTRRRAGMEVWRSGSVKAWMGVCRRVDVRAWLSLKMVSIALTSETDHLTWEEELIRQEICKAGHP